MAINDSKNNESNKNAIQDGVSIKSDTSSTKVEKANDESKAIKLSFDWFKWGNKDTPAPRMVTSNDSSESVVPLPSSIETTKKDKAVLPENNSTPPQDTNTIIQYVNNTVAVKAYIMIYFSILIEGKSVQKKAFLSSAYIKEINVSRSVRWGADSTFNTTISFHDEYLVSDTLNGDSYSVNFTDLFQLGNIIDSIVFTHVGYADYFPNGDIQNKDFQEKVFLLQRGALAGYYFSMGGNGDKSIVLRIETIDVYANRTKVYISLQNEGNNARNLKGKTSDQAGKYKDEIAKIKKNLNTNNKWSRWKNLKRLSQLNTAILELSKKKVMPEQTTFESTSIDHVSKVSKLIEFISRKDFGRKRGQLTLDAIYSYIASTFMTTILFNEKDSQIITRKLYKEFKIMDYSVLSSTLIVVDDNDKSLIGTVSGESDYLYDNNLGEFKFLSNLVGEISALNGSEYTFSSLVPKIAFPLFHEVYYDPFVELELSDANNDLMNSNKSSKLNQILLYADEKLEKNTLKRITKPSFVLRHFPVSGMFKEVKEKKTDSSGGEIIEESIDYVPNSVIIYEISQESILNFSVEVSMDKIKTGIQLGAKSTLVSPIKHHLDAIIFGSNIHFVKDVPDPISSINAKSLKMFKMLEEVLTGRDGYFGEADLTCIFSPMRAGNVVRIPIDNKYAYGYIDTVRDSFSSGGEALTHLKLKHLNLDSIYLLMGLVDDESVSSMEITDAAKSGDKSASNSSQKFTINIS
jgi:hypothetical protein